MHFSDNLPAAGPSLYNLPTSSLDFCILSIPSLCGIVDWKKMIQQQSAFSTRQVVLMTLGLKELTGDCIEVVTRRFSWVEPSTTLPYHFLSPTITFGVGWTITIQLWWFSNWKNWLVIAGWHIEGFLLGGVTSSQYHYPNLMILDGTKHNLYFTTSSHYHNPNSNSDDSPKRLTRLIANWWNRGVSPGRVEQSGACAATSSHYLPLTQPPTLCLPSVF